MKQFNEAESKNLERVFQKVRDKIASEGATAVYTNLSYSNPGGKSVEALYKAGVPSKRNLDTWLTDAIFNIAVGEASKNTNPHKLKQDVSGFGNPWSCYLLKDLHLIYDLDEGKDSRTHQIIRPKTFTVIFLGGHSANPYYNY